MKYKPCNEKYMAKEYPENTICQVLRETYHLTNEPLVKMNLRVAVSMAKAMTKKLREYKADWSKGFWDEHH